MGTKIGIDLNEGANTGLLGSPGHRATDMSLTSIVNPNIKTKATAKQSLPGSDFMQADPRLTRPGDRTFENTMGNLGGSGRSVGEYSGASSANRAPGANRGTNMPTAKQDSANPLYDPKAIASATGDSEEDIKRVTPYIIAELKKQGIYSENTLIGVLATVAVESNFRPVVEGYYLKPDRRTELYNSKLYGRIDPVTNQRYFGRGFVQLTGKNNYAKYGKDLGIDLVNNPDLALDPAAAARILVLFFKDNNLQKSCNSGDWRGVRYGVNRGYNGMKDFTACVNNLQKACSGYKSRKK